jgi:uncharacterized protein YgbK (DUF1537 family)
MTDWLIIADDLTGAADCGSAFVRHGLDAVVSWGDIDPDASILAVDADSRHLPAGAAAACQVAALAAHWRPGMRLYKKIDSTLRGQPAAELAAKPNHEPEPWPGAPVVAQQVFLDTIPRVAIRIIGS